MATRTMNTLLRARAGEILLIEDLSGSERTTRRLADLGLAAGTDVQKLHGGRFGATIVMVGATRLAISRKLAARVTVSTLLSKSVA